MARLRPLDGILPSAKGFEILLVVALELGAGLL
jgi:hypothetical protein